MSDTPNSDDAFCESLLTPSTVAASKEFRQSVLNQTLGLLRRRRRLRQWTVAAALAACFLGGMLIMRWVLAPETALPGGPQEEMAQRQREANPLLSPSPRPADTALGLEWQALDSPTRRPELDRLAGDRYLAEETDARSALRCYERALDGNADLTISPDDSWLLMAIKDARQKEKRDGKNDG
jgi:hypothetical protein